MKKGNFEIEITNMENPIVLGLLSENFGIYKIKKGQYSVTHLKTGGNVMRFDRQKDAKKFVEEAEKIPGIENMNLNNCQDFLDDLFDIVKIILDI